MLRFNLKVVSDREKTDVETTGNAESKKKEKESIYPKAWTCMMEKSLEITSGTMDRFEPKQATSGKLRDLSLNLCLKPVSFPFLYLTVVLTLT